MGDNGSSAAAAEARWRNYQHLIWTQQQIQLQIQQQHHHQQQHQQQTQQNHHQSHQQQMQNQKMQNAIEMEGNNNGLQQPVQMAEKSLEEKPKSETADPWDNFDAQAAFLGPTLWDKRLPYDGQDFKLEYVDLEEFLTENGIPVESHHQQDNHFMKNGHAPANNNSGMSSDQMSNSECSPPNGGGPPHHQLGHYGPGPSRNQGHINNGNHPNLMKGPSSINHSENSRSPSPCGSSISHSSDESDSTNHLDSLQNGLPMYSNGVKFSISELAVASIPGPDFDPRTRIFTEDELKPQPMIKKSKKQFVPDEQKDAKYWARRRKNNMAAKRSRDARRVKENQIAMRACFLEKENSLLKQEIDRIQKENMMLKEQLNCCRREH